MKQLKFAWVMLLLLTCSPHLISLGQTQGTIPGPQAVSPAKASAIHRVLELTGSAKLVQQVIRQTIAISKSSFKQVPDSLFDDLEKEFASDLEAGKFESVIVPIYDRHFSETELNELIQFYESPIGRKVIAELPQIASESMAAGQQWGDQIYQRIQQKLKEKGYSPTGN